MGKKLTTDEFIHKAKDVHGNKFDYHLTNYINYDTKVKIICPEHGIIEQTPRTHLENDCKKCCMQKRAKTTEDFINESKIVHGDLYEYSLVNYINRVKKVKIICKEHGIFEQIPYLHLKGCICYKCFAKNKCESTEDFIEKSKIIHGDKYEYFLVKYENVTTKIKITCKTHGVFEQSPSSHLRGFGCQICKNSKGEEKISEFLKSKDIKFEREKRFLNCRNILPLPFDFYIPEHNTCIEFDGEQHFVEKPEWNNNLVNIQKRDEIKNIYCKENNILLYRFNYKEIDDIDKKLDKIFI